MKTKVMKRHWTVITYEANGDWADQSDEISSHDVAEDTAKKLAEISRDGRFVVMEHIALRAYARSKQIVTVAA